MSGITRTVTGVVILLLASRCDREPTAAPPPPAGTATAPELAEMPFPELSALEPRVRDQLEKGRSRLDTDRRRWEAGEIRPEELGRSFGNLGLIYHAYHLRDAADVCYRRARRLDRNEFRWRYYHARLHGEESRPGEAVASYRHALELEPEHVPSRVYLGRVLLELGRLEEAEREFNTVLNQDPQCVPAWVEKGRLALRRRRYRQAIEFLETARVRYPEAAEVNYPLGLAYRELGELDLARECLNRRGAQRVDGALDDPLGDELKNIATGMRIHNNRGGTFFLQRRYEEAAAEFRRALEADPEDTTVRTNLGSALEMLGEREAAKEQYREALSRDPGNVLANFNLGTLLAGDGDDRAAIEHYSVALSGDPRHLDTHFNLANALRRQGRFAEAYEHYHAVIEQQPGHETARQAEALTLIRLGRFREALQTAEEGHRVLPDSLPIRHILARLLAASPEKDLCDGSRALKLANETFASRRSAQHAETVAMAWARLGRYDQAIAWQERVLEAVRQRDPRPRYAETLAHNLSGYRRGQPCRQPWSPDDPALAPGPRRPRRPGPQRNAMRPRHLRRPPRGSERP